MLCKTSKVINEIICSLAWFSRNGKGIEREGRGGEGKEGMGREGKGRKGMDREGKGREGKGKANGLLVKLKLK